MTSLLRGCVMVGHTLGSGLAGLPLAAAGWVAAAAAAAVACVSLNASSRCLSSDLQAVSQVLKAGMSQSFVCSMIR